MKVKITTAQQLANLKAGDEITKYPVHGDAESYFDDSQKRRIDTYRVNTIDITNDMLGLVMCGSSVYINSAPGNVGRLFIKRGQLITQSIWWV
jgi:hypothetical protein